MLNKVTLIGNVGKDPEMRSTREGKAVANFSMATSETWRDKSTGEKKERTEWHRITCFNEALCRIIEQYVNKGDKLYIEGQMQTRKWEDQQGVERWTTEVVLQGFNAKLIMLGSAGGQRSAEDYGHDPDRAAGPAASTELDDEIPFLYKEIEFDVPDIT